MNPSLGPRGEKSEKQQYEHQGHRTQGQEVLQTSPAAYKEPFGADLRYTVVPNHTFWTKSNRLFCAS